MSCEDEEEESEGDGGQVLGRELEREGFGVETGLEAEIAGGELEQHRRADPGRCQRDEGDDEGDELRPPEGRRRRGGGIEPVGHPQRALSPDRLGGRENECDGEEKEVGRAHLVDHQPRHRPGFGVEDGADGPAAAPEVGDPQQGNDEHRWADEEEAALEADGVEEAASRRGRRGRSRPWPQGGHRLGIRRRPLLHPLPLGIERAVGDGEQSYGGGEPGQPGL